VAKEVINNSVKNLVKNVKGEMRQAAESNESLITEELLRSVMKGQVNDETIRATLERIHNIEESDGLLQDYFEEKFLSYTDLIGPGVSVDRLINAIKFVSHVQTGCSNTRAYELVFPVKTLEIKARKSDTSSFATEYAKSKTVVEILSRSAIHAHIEFLPVRNQLIKKLVDLTNGVGAKVDDYVSPTVQLNAALGALDYLRPPEDKSIELKVGLNEEAMQMQQNLAKQIAESAELMRQQFQSGRSLREVQRVGIVIDTEIEE
jgi:hypothetical protein